MYEDHNDSDIEVLKIVFWLVIGFVFCTYQTWNEIRYWFAGETTTARILRMHESVDATVVGSTVRGHQIQEVRLEYLDQNGQRIQQTINFPPGWFPPADRQVTIQYRPGVPESARWPGSVTYAFVWVWVVYISAIVVFFAWMHRLANEPTVSFREKRRRKRLARRKKRFARYANR